MNIATKSQAGPVSEDSLINKWGPTQPVGGASPGSIFAAAMGDHDHGSFFLSTETDPVVTVGKTS